MKNLVNVVFIAVATYWVMELISKVLVVKTLVDGLVK